MMKLSSTLCSDKIHQGGAVAAPIASQILGEVLPYLELKKDNQTEEEQTMSVTMPDIRNMSIKDAKKMLKENNLELNLEEELDEENTIIKEQTPKPGIVVNSGNKVYVEY